MRSILRWWSGAAERRRARFGHFLGLSAAAVLMLATAGCAIVDQYAGRATVYNLESEQTHDQGLLLNIVRASLRRPRQFTIVQKITGSATAESSASLTIPFGPHLGTAQTANAGTISAGASGGPSFEVAALETNEFFAGILQPISAQLFDLYVHSEFPNDLLFNLFIEKIVMRRMDGICLMSHLRECEIVFQNYPGRDVQLELFQALVGYLMNLGLSTEKLPTPKKKKDKKSAAAGDDDSDDDDSADSGGGIAKTQPYAFCFSPRERYFAAYVPLGSVCGNRTPSNARLGETSVTYVRMSPDFVRSTLLTIVESNFEKYGKEIPVASQNPAYAFKRIADFAGQPVSLTIYSRSTESLISYLGEVVRRQLHPDIDSTKRIVMTKVGPPFNRFDERPCAIDEQRRACTPVFVLEENAPPEFSSTFVVTYEGVRYAIPAASGAGGTYETTAGSSYTVLTVLRQLLILSTKAKALPATNVQVTR